jgi:methylenetetrahydrofolate dehydrogenase (NADP+) / methenyltetrahydrofolate cyclohydrolase
MTATILSGKEVSATLLDALKIKVKQLNPKLVVVQVGDDPASSSYIKQKMASCEAVGMRHTHIHLSEDTTKEELFDLIHELNEDSDVTGFIVQLPLPKHLQPLVNDVIEAIHPPKDVDGFGAKNLGEVFLSAEREMLPPATPSGVIAMLEHYQIEVTGKHAVIVGKSNIVGKPLAVMLNRAATVSICHSKTADLGAMTRQADILIVAVGKANLVTKDMVKPGAVVIDVGMNRVDGKLCGDVDFDAVKEIVSAITPVPGGVGPLTVASLIRNCVRAKELQKS